MKGRAVWASPAHTELFDAVGLKNSNRPRIWSTFDDGGIAYWLGWIGHADQPYKHRLADHYRSGWTEEMVAELKVKVRLSTC